WTSKPAGDLYVAGIVGDNVVVVGQFGCRAVSLKDGKPLWKLELGPPAGTGVFQKTTYLLPLKKGAASKQPEIAYLDVERGKLVGTSPLKEVPGNLVLVGQQILSQSLGEITGYRPGKEK